MRLLLPLLENAYFPATVADAGIGIVDAAKLAGGNALNGLVGMDVVAFIIESEGAGHKVVHMTHLELDGLVYGVLPRIGSDEVHVG